MMSESHEVEDSEDEVTGFIKFSGLDRDLDFDDNLDPGLYWGFKVIFSLKSRNSFNFMSYGRKFTQLSHYALYKIVVVP